MADKADYYKILGVPKNAADAEIKKAFKKMAMKYHPDRNQNDPSAEAKFKECKEAYEILSDPQKRSVYDQFGHDAVNQAQGGGGFGGFGGFGGGGAGGFGDIFEDIFADMFGGGARGGGASRGRGGQRGADLRYAIELSLEEAVKGVSKALKIPTLVACKTCNGSGAKKGSKPVTCSQCRGVGQVRMQQGFFSVQQTCPACHGQGRMIQDPCSDCRGQGRRQDEKTLQVKIPAGVDEGDRVRLAGEGEAGSQGGGAGDLYVEIHLKPHRIFKREENDLHCDIPISFTMAALGGEIEIPTLEGKVKLKIAPETQSGRLFRLRGKGVRSIRGHTQGDMICRAVVETPVNLNREQRELLKQLDDSMSDDQRRFSPRTSTWFDSVKKFFEDMRL